MHVFLPSEEPVKAVLQQIMENIVEHTSTEERVEEKGKRLMSQLPNCKHSTRLFVLSCFLLYCVID